MGGKTDATPEKPQILTATDCAAQEVFSRNSHEVSHFPSVFLPQGRYTP
jgi:hypothetical protein